MGKGRHRKASWRGLSLWYYSVLWEKGNSLTELSLGQGIQFFLVNLIAGLGINLLYSTLISAKASLFFLGISYMIFAIPISLLALVFIAAIFHFVTWLLKGSGSFKDTLLAILLSSTPLALLGFENLWGIMNLGLFYLLVVNFRYFHSYSLISAVINVCLPFFAYLLVFYGVF